MSSGGDKEISGIPISQLIPQIDYKTQETMKILVRLNKLIGETKPKGKDAVSIAKGMNAPSICKDLNLNLAHPLR
jgi:hypothetical protein